MDALDLAWVFLVVLPWALVAILAWTVHRGRVERRQERRRHSRELAECRGERDERRRQLVQSQQDALVARQKVDRLRRMSPLLRGLADGMGESDEQFLRGYAQALDDVSRTLDDQLEAS